MNGPNQMIAGLREWADKAETDYEVDGANAANIVRQAAGVMETKVRIIANLENQLAIQKKIIDKTSRILYDALSDGGES